MKDRIDALQTSLKALKIDGYLVPSCDEYQGEYIPDHARRLEWITGFTGSNGLAIMGVVKNAFFTDGRYVLQAQQQVGTEYFELYNLSNKKALGEFCQNKLIGFDPWLHTEQQINYYQKIIDNFKARLVPIDGNLIDAIWLEKPSALASPISLHEPVYSGQSSYDKRQEIALSLRAKNIDACLITAPDSVCWLLNIRGNDVAYTPFVLARAILHQDGNVDLFVNTDQTFDMPDVRVHPASEILTFCDQFKDKTIQLDPASAPTSLISRLKSSRLVKEADPCQLPKACKNPVEIAGAINSHLEDGVVICLFLKWLEDNLGKIPISEITIADKLLEFRQARPNFSYPSFATIAGFKEHGAIIHYHATALSNKLIEPNGLLLIDSGGQYKGGTTDVTRTVVIGSSTQEERDNFTKVLKGHIALAMAKFPAGTTGSQLDAIARYHLWQTHQDYAHGTGHGVGSYLSVHEGPQRIGSAANNVALMPGMIVSNEPGFYQTGQYGIRIESLLLVVEDGDGFLAFQTLTQAPLDQRLINRELLNKAEIDWINHYHHTIYHNLKPLLDAKTLDWLQGYTSNNRDN